MFVISSADTSASSWGPTNTRDCQHHLEKWVWRPSVPRASVLRTLTSNISKHWEQSKIHHHRYTYICTLTICFAIIRSTIIICLIVSTFPQTLHPNSYEFTSIPRSQLKPDATYCIKVRSKPNPDGYKGIWSKWSLSTCWKNEAGEGKVTL